MPRLLGKSGLIGLRKATVQKVNGDKTGCNNIKVKLCASGLKFDNVPVAVDMASKNFGRVVIPKKGDNVIVGFFDADIEQPVVLGSFYTPNRKPPIKVKKKNNINYFQTDAGIKITIDDSKKKSGIYVETKDGHKLELKDGSKQLLQLKSKDGKTSLKIDLKKSKVEIKCETMQVTANKKVAMKAGDSELSVKNGSGVTIKSPKGSVKINANNIKGKANASVKLDGTNIKFNANAKFDAKANAAANLKSSGMTSVGGSMVKIG